MDVQLLTKSSTGVVSACTAFELGDQVLLVAAVVGREHDLVGCVGLLLNLIHSS
jgi:hypothetical protein